MTILLTGATGYIGNRLLPVLLADGHRVVCAVRNSSRFDTSDYSADLVEVIEVNFLEKESLANIPAEIDAAYYLIHSMSAVSGNFEELERISAQNFKERIEETLAKQVIYLSGIVNEETLSKHLSSRKAVEILLSEGSFHLTTLRAGIILGSGSASFEIIRDLVEKLPVMIAPRWLNTKSQPIAIRNVIQFLKGVLLMKDCYDQSFDIGGHEVLTYRQMLLKFARVRHLKRSIGVVPFMTPKLSSYWLYFITSTSYKLAVNLVNSMKVEVVCENDHINEIIKVDLLGFEEAVKEALDPSRMPSFGCFTDQKKRPVKDRGSTLERIWSLGDKKGWYNASWLWKLRGMLDKAIGGVGLRMVGQSSSDLKAGDILSFWKVLHADREKGNLLLYSEMKLPGEAWLEFSIEQGTFIMSSVFRPLGQKGRFYWYATLALHHMAFRSMINRIVADQKQ